MTDHSEFPWGPQYEPGLLTPLGVIGWIIAAALLAAFLYAQRNPSGGKTHAGQLDDIHKIVHAAARHALKQDEFGILRGADMLRRVIRTYLGGVILAGGLGRQVKKISEAMGESDDKKKDDKGHGGKDHGHGGGHGGKASAIAQSVTGPSITVNVGMAGEKGEDGHGGHDDHGGGHGGGGHGGGHDKGHDDHDEKPPTLEEQLILVRKAVREFEAWWSDKPARISELRAAQDDLTKPKKPDPAILALLEEKK